MESVRYFGQKAPAKAAVAGAKPGGLEVDLPRGAQTVLLAYPPGISAAAFQRPGGCLVVGNVTRPTRRVQTAAAHAARSASDAFDASLVVCGWLGGGAR